MEVLNYKPRRPAVEEDTSERDEDLRRLNERWRFDCDFSSPDVGTDEEDRVLIDDFDTKYGSLHLLRCLDLTVFLDISVIQRISFRKTTTPISLLTLDSSCTMVNQSISSCHSKSPRR